MTPNSPHFPSSFVLKYSGLLIYLFISLPTTRFDACLLCLSEAEGHGCRMFQHMPLRR